MKKFIKATAIFLIICAVLSAPTVYRGYMLYRDAVTKAPVLQKAEEIRSMPDFTKLEDISDYFIKEIIREEDKRFYYHIGFDLLAIVRATKNDLIAGSFVEGGSTITQQLAKNMYFDFGKVLDRKVAEVFTAIMLERKFSKDEILELYINCINYGEDCFGLGSATKYYYGSTPGDLTEEQADALIYAIKCPVYYNPVALGLTAGQDR